MDTEHEIFAESLRAFQKRHVEPVWERLDSPDAQQYGKLFSELHELGVPTLALTEAQGGLSLDARTQLTILRALGACSPALGAGLISHVTAYTWLLQAGDGPSPELRDAFLSGARFAWVGSPLDAAPDTPFRLTVNGKVSLTGKQRVSLAFPQLLVVPAVQEGRLRLCIVRSDTEGLRFAVQPSPHGLGLVPVGELTLDHVVLRPEDVLEWPSSTRGAREADALLCALLCGMLDELAERSMSYALSRYQGGKMIHEHDAVRELTGPIELSRRVLSALALATLSDANDADGGASAFGVERVRQAGLDAVQTFGGAGYMEDYRVERYLRDANTLETSWIHAAYRTREIARARFSHMAEKG